MKAVGKNKNTPRFKEHTKMFVTIVFFTVAILGAFIWAAVELVLALS